MINNNDTFHYLFNELNNIQFKNHLIFSKDSPLEVSHKFDNFSVDIILKEDQGSDKAIFKDVDNKELFTLHHRSTPNGFKEFTLLLSVDNKYLPSSQIEEILSIVNAQSIWSTLTQKAEKITQEKNTAFVEIENKLVHHILHYFESEPVADITDFKSFSYHQQNTIHHKFFSSLKYFDNSCFDAVMKNKQISDELKYSKDFGNFSVEINIPNQWVKNPDVIFKDAQGNQLFHILEVSPRNASSKNFDKILTCKVTHGLNNDYSISFESIAKLFDSLPLEKVYKSIENDLRAKNDAIKSTLENKPEVNNVLETMKKIRAESFRDPTFKTQNNTI